VTSTPLRGPCCSAFCGTLPSAPAARSSRCSQKANFDWLLYQLLAKHFAREPRVQFALPDGPDCLYRVYNHRYLLTHGDQFRGGDGLIGCLGPIVRGDHKKRSRNNQVDQGYDTLLLGHWHQLFSCSG
jgi:hypothetical protein